MWANNLFYHAAWALANITLQTHPYTPVICNHCPHHLREWDGLMCSAGQWPFEFPSRPVSAGLKILNKFTIPILAKKQICAFQVSRPYLSFCPDHKHFTVNSEENTVKNAEKSGKMFVCVCWGLTSQSTIFQSHRDGATASWVINQYFRGVRENVVKNAISI